MQDHESRDPGGTHVNHQIDDISVRLAKIETYFKVAFTIGAVFGIGGVWGYQAITTATSNISVVEKQLDEVADIVEDVETRAAEIDELLPNLKDQLNALKLDTAEANYQAKLAKERISTHAANSVVQLKEESEGRKSEIQQQAEELKSQIDSDRLRAIESMSEEQNNALEALKSAEDTAIRLARRQIQMSLSEATQEVSWNDCVWSEVGLDKSHYPESGAWCPPGKFVTQLDLGRHMVKDFVEKVRCCSIRYDQSGAQVSSDAENLALDREQPRPEVIAEASGG